MGEPKSFWQRCRGFSRVLPKSFLGAKPALRHTEWAGRGLTKTDHSKGATTTGLPVDGGVVGGVSQHLLGDMRKPPASPRSGARRAGRRPLERPQATAGWRCSRAASTARRAKAARRFLQKPTQPAQALRRLHVGSAGGLVC